MSARLLYFGQLWAGSTSLQRLRAFRRIDDLTAIGIDSGARMEEHWPLWRRIRWKMRLPADALEENRSLASAVAEHHPDIVFVDNSKVISRRTLAAVRKSGARTLVYYSPDDLAARHNLSLPLKWSLPDWDVVCTTKTFNIPELPTLGARRVVLVGKAFDPELHRPLDRAAEGGDFERFDAVFIGSYERDRCASINALAESGVRVVVYGMGRWPASAMHRNVELRPSAYGSAYVKAWHTGKVALCFLRKLNRDRITQRTMEIAAIGRPMVAERTDEHDRHFRDGTEYLGFSGDAELIRHVHDLLGDRARRTAIGAAGRRRCLASAYSTVDRARQMLDAFNAVPLDHRADAGAASTDAAQRT